MNSAYVDMYNATNNSWSRFPNGLGLARHGLAAASLPSGLVFFAGGYGAHNCARAWQLQRVVLCSRAVAMALAACLRCCRRALEVCIVLTHAF